MAFRPLLPCHDPGQKMQWYEKLQKHRRGRGAGGAGLTVGGYGFRTRYAKDVFSLFVWNNFIFIPVSGTSQLELVGMASTSGLLIVAVAGLSMVNDVPCHVSRDLTCGLHRKVVHFESFVLSSILPTDSDNTPFGFLFSKDQIKLETCHADKEERTCCKYDKNKGSRFWCGDHMQDFLYACEAC